MGTTVVFDLDATLTREETLPLAARLLGLDAPMAALTRQGAAGEAPYAPNLLARINLLAPWPVAAVREAMETAALHEGLAALVRAHRKQCLVATSNLDVWAGGLLARLGCPAVCSAARVERGRLLGVDRLADKAGAVRALQRRGERVVFVGDGRNDAAAMRVADVGIACGLVRRPPPEVTAAARYEVADEAALCALLEAFL